MDASLDHSLKVTITLFKPVFDTSLDAVGVVDLECRIRFANPLMRALLGVSTREIAQAPVFCDCLTLAACSQECEIKKVLTLGKELRLDEAPAGRDDVKMRVSLKAVPLHYPGKQRGQLLGAIISARETTGEILLQAKYHRTMLLLQEKEQEIAELMVRIKTKDDALRRARR